MNTVDFRLEMLYNGIVIFGEDNFLMSDIKTRYLKTLTILELNLLNFISLELDIFIHSPHNTTILL